MAITTYEEIKNQIREELGSLLENPYAEDALAEMADAEVPVYNHLIIQEWCELPTDARDEWKELGYDTQRNEGGILRLMSVDLSIYYLRQFDQAWQELKEEHED